ncbi:hypothetical protein [Nocardia sp. NPDC048505]|uniref:hypothetical protein n=1 Tax=unclassified Nocardia TaxID=2637762 RepID=UPI00340CB8D2
MPIEQAARIVRMLEVLVTGLAGICLLLALLVQVPPTIMVIFGLATAYGCWTFTRPITS